MATKKGTDDTITLKDRTSSMTSINGPNTNKEDCPPEVRPSLPETTQEDRHKIVVTRQQNSQNAIATSNINAEEEKEVNSGMDSTIIKILQMPQLKEPILIEGLPGQGNISGLAAEQLLKQLHAKKFAEIYSPYFPNCVIIKNGILRAPRNELFYAHAGKNDVIIWVGDTQATSSIGHYELVERVLDEMKKIGVKQIFALGAYTTNKHSTRPKVIGVGDIEILRKLEKWGVVIKKKEPGAIFGASGLLIALGQLRGIPSVGLMGETCGLSVDYRAAQAVLQVLGDMLGIKIDTSYLEQEAKAVEQIVDKIYKEIELREQKKRKHEEKETWYIG